ncbi:alpha/beta hydrolase [Aeoliella sp.]|uniref:alpha/beta hydrolase n=1 Tax=Aeoliella sp. TaxID=2795800 RepID=UPI003CCC3A27
MHRLAGHAASNHPWNKIIPTPPEGGFGTALKKPRARSAFDAPISTFLPLNYEAGYSYPLVVWLHETGGNERHLPQIMQHLSMQNFVAVAPRGSHECHHNARGYRWVQQPSAICSADNAVSEAVQLAHAQFNINTDRIFLVGHAEGGTMAMRLAMQSPEQFAGVASINGCLPRRHSVLRNVNRLRTLPFFLASAREFEGYPEPTVCHDLRMLHSAGCGVSLRQYPGDDDLTTSMLADVNRWIMDQVCG